MSMTITARNVNHALAQAIWHFRTAGVKADSRNGPVVRLPGVVITEYTKPCERLCLLPERDANHVFHLVESLWMFAGMDDVSPLLPFNSKYAQYAEEDWRQHGAYGYRWRKHFGNEQIMQVMDELKHNPYSRRVVLTMWDPQVDLGADVADVPCNTHAYFDVVDGHVNMTVCNRSNDVIWGAYGANAVHFSMLLELVASGAGLEVGVYRQVSNNFHIYTEMGQGRALMENPQFEVYDPYTAETPLYVPKLLLAGETAWDFMQDCRRLFGLLPGSPTNNFMRTVAEPLMTAYLMRKAGEEYGHYLDIVPECDWKFAFTKWTERRA